MICGMSLRRMRFQSPHLLHAACLAWAVLLPGMSLHAQPVLLNEIVSANASGIEDEDGDRPDWIELFNPGSASIHLAGYGLSDNPAIPFKWRFPIKLIPARGFLLVFASGKDRTNAAMLHSNFRVSASGETVVLTRPDSRESDRMGVPPLPAGVAFGRQPDGSQSLFFLATPTPGSANRSAAGDAVLQAPLLSKKAGWHEAPFELELSTPDSSADLRYTLDGSEPTSQSPRYTGPIPIRDRRLDPDLLSMIQGTSTNNQHTDGWKAPRKTVRKGTVVRVRSFRERALPGPTTTATYFIGTKLPERLPVISLGISPAELFDFEKGIYVLGKVFEDWRKLHPTEALTGHSPANYTQRGPAWERPASLEYFDPSGTLAIAREVQLDIQGQSSRSFRQKSLGVKVLAEPVGYELFPGARRRGDGSPLLQFRHLRLRNSGNDWTYTMFRDGLCHKLVEGLPIDAQYYSPAVVFLDGEYWGIHNIREMHDAEYLAAHYGVVQSDAVICSGPGTLEEGAPGSELPYLALREFIRTHDLSLAANYENVERQVDLDNFILYHAANIYFGNADWPHNNLRVWRDASGKAEGGSLPPRDGRWRWLLFDCDLAYGHPWSGGVSDETLAAAISPTGRPGLGSDGAWSTMMLRALLKNAGFKRGFLNTQADLLNSWFRENRAGEAVESMSGALAPAMAEHLDRWRTAASTNEWMTHVRVLRQFASQRPAVLRQHYVTHFRLGGYTPLTVDVSSPEHGRVRVNRLLIDAALPGAGTNAYPWRGWYFRGVPVELEALPHPGWAFERWEPPAGVDAALARGSIVTWNPGEAAAWKAVFRPLLPGFGSVTRLESGRIAVEVTGDSAGRYRLEQSSDFKTWSVDRIVTLDGKGAFQLELEPMVGTSRFFRLARE